MTKSRFLNKRIGVHLTPKNLVNRLILFVLAAICNTNTKGQVFEKVCDLPIQIHESSGLLSYGNGRFLTHNDGANDPNLYLIDTSSNLLRIIKVANMENNDWEDLASDGRGTVYIGDFGNNSQARKNLQIGVLENFNDSTSDSLNASFITFEYADQREFPPPISEQRFDCEAMAWHSDSIYLITKNWTSPFTGFAYLYVLPAVIGHHKAQKVDSFNFGTYREISWVTGMDVKSNEMALVGTAYCWRFSFNKTPRFDSLVAKIEILPLSQKEAIAYGGHDIYITDESTGGYGNLYRIQNYDKANLEHVVRDIPKIYSAPNGWFLSGLEGVINIEIWDILGKLHTSFDMSISDGELVLWRENEQLCSGAYIIVVRYGQNTIVKKMVSKLE